MRNAGCLVVLFLFVSVSPLAAEPRGESAVPRGETAAPTLVTFNEHIAPIIFENCSTCHRAGEVAPFALLDYTDVKKRARQIQAITAKRFMPPWKSVAGHGRFVDERRLTDEQIERIARWVAQGATEGNPDDRPPTPQFRDDWKLGEPDVVLTMPEPYCVPAEGPDIYRNFVLSLDVPPGKYIKAVEYRPGNRAVVHHAALAIDTVGISRKQDEDDPEPGFPGSLTLPGQLFPGSLAAWAPGRDPLPLPDGFSMPWKPGADLILQLHLHPSGKPETEQSSLGFYFTDEPPRRSIVDVVLIDRKIDIPAGERNYRTRDEFTLPIDADAFGIFPHMHMIGREIKVTAHPPRGGPFSLLWIDDWDFNWQNFYQYAEPVRLLAGTRIVLEAVHDNSADNFRNPNVPPQRVTWGEQTTDEMSVAVIQLVPVREADLPTLYQQRRRILGAVTAKGSASVETKAPVAFDPDKLLKQFDRDGDGKLSLDELAATGRDKAILRQVMLLFDRDGDGLLSESELKAAAAALGKP